MSKIQSEETDASTVKGSDGCYNEDVILQKIYSMVKKAYFYIKKFILNRK